jgi:hypothetical protein
MMRQAMAPRFAINTFENISVLGAGQSSAGYCQGSSPCFFASCGMTEAVP